MIYPQSVIQLALLLTLATQGSWLSAKELEGVRAPAANTCPTVEEARAKMTVPPGYEVRAFAAEPDVVNPVAMDFDARGRLWVAELYEYPSGSKTPSPFAQKVSDQNYRPVPAATPGLPRDRIVILEDTDNDGRADKRTVFLEGLNLASGLCVADGGIYVGMTPHLLHFRDTDGDDRADQWKVVLTGFGRQDTHELINSFQLGPDGALFFTQGVFTTSQVRRPQDAPNKALKMDTGLGRVVLDRSKLAAEGPFGSFELFADGLSNSWGFDYDSAGNFFAEACVIDHLFHVAPGGVYQRQAGAPGNPYAYELLPSIVDYKHFRSAYAGLTVYQGGAYPADTDGHIFLGNIHANAIHEERVEPRGASFKAFPVRDFLKGNDGWFRPVQIRTGPDGFLWVMDWCDKYPCYQNAVANPAGVDRERGRIWRVCHTGTEAGKKLAAQSRTSKDLDLAKAPIETLLNSLADTNNWTRRTARRLLVERMPADSGDLVTTLQAKVLKSTNASERHEALWTLAGAKTGPWKDEFFTSATKHEDPVVRGWTVRTDNSFTKENFQGRRMIWFQLFSDKVPFAHSAAISAIKGLGWTGELPESEVSRGEFEADLRMMMTLAALDVLSDGDDKRREAQLWMALEFSLSSPGINLYLEALVSLPDSAQAVRIAKKAARKIAVCEPGKIPLLLQRLLMKPGQPNGLTVGSLEGLLESGAKPTDELVQILLRFAHCGHEPTEDVVNKLLVKWCGVGMDKLTSSVRDNQTPLPERISNIRILAEKNPALLQQMLGQLLQQGGDDAWMTEVVGVTAKIGQHRILVRSLDSMSAQVKATALQSFTSGYESADYLISSMFDRKDSFSKETKLTFAELSPALKRQLLQAVHPQNRPTNRTPSLDPFEDTPPSAEEFQKRLKREAEDFYAAAQKHLGTFNDTPEALRNLITTKRSAMLAGTPDLVKGRQAFEAMCAVCHEFQGVGKKVGPDLNGSGRANLDNLLHNLIAPNEVIGSGYENWRLTTKDGRAVTGRLIEKTDRHVRLLGAGGIEETIAAEQVAKMENTGESLMPTGFGELSDDTLRDLVWYLLAPPSEGELTPEKKAKLAESNE